MTFMTVPDETVASAQGKDISNFQGVLAPSFWNGFQFGFAKATEGTTFTDGTFGANWANMKKAGIHRGAYHFFHPAVNAKAQAQFFFNEVKKNGLEPGDMLVADVEINSGGALKRAFQRGNRNNLTQKPVDLSIVDTTAKVFLDEVKALAGTKYPILVYTDLSVGSQLVTCTGYPLWIAFPSGTSPASVKPWNKWTFWQWGQTGVDRDAFNGTAADLQAFINSYANPAVGLFRHILPADTSVADLATQRNVTPNAFLSRQAAHFNSIDAKSTILKAGSIYYTIHP